MADRHSTKKHPTHHCCGRDKMPNDWVASCLTCGKMGCRHCMVIENQTCRHRSCPPTSDQQPGGN